MELFLAGISLTISPPQVFEQFHGKGVESAYDMPPVVGREEWCYAKLSSPPSSLCFLKVNFAAATIAFTEHCFQFSSSEIFFCFVHVTGIMIEWKPVQGS